MRDSVVSEINPGWPIIPDRFGFRDRGPLDRPHVVFGGPDVENSVVHLNGLVTANSQGVIGVLDPGNHLALCEADLRLAVMPGFALSESRNALSGVDLANCRADPNPTKLATRTLHRSLPRNFWAVKVVGGLTVVRRHRPSVAIGKVERSDNEEKRKRNTAPAPRLALRRFADRCTHRARLCMIIGIDAI